MSESNDADPPSTVFDEPPLYKGVCSTINHLKGQGVQLAFDKMQTGSFINLEYCDEFGNEISPKEAYKQLSRKFHGKELGKARKQKLISKIKEEKVTPVKKPVPKKRKRIFGMPE